MKTSRGFNEVIGMSDFEKESQEVLRTFGFDENTDFRKLIRTYISENSIDVKSLLGDEIVETMEMSWGPIDLSDTKKHTKPRKPIRESITVTSWSSFSGTERGNQFNLLDIPLCQIVC